MASSNYTKYVLGGFENKYSRSVLGGSEEDYSRSVLGGSEEDYSRSVLGGSDEDYSRTVLGGSDDDYSRSVLGGSDEDYSRSVLGGSDMDYGRTIFSGSDEVKEALCEPCHNDGKNTTAVKYCSNCSECLCGPCSKKHVNFKDFRTHTLKEVDTVKHFITEDRTEIINKSTNKQAKVDKSSEQAQQNQGHVISSSGAIRNVTANLVSTIDVSTSNDNKSPYLYDLTVVQTHYCVGTDMKNTSVKVIETRSRRVTSEIQLRDAADYGWSITSVNDDQVAVAVKIKGVWKILLFSVSASGIISDTHKSIDVESAYLGITHSNDRFYATALCRIDVISMQGQIITTFTNKSFRGLCGIALSNDHNTLYVCDYDNHTVFGVDLNGNVTASYKDKNLKEPQGITVDSDGYVYVCSHRTNCVHQLTAELRKVKVIIKDVHVWSCAFNKNDNSLNLRSSNGIIVYNLTCH